jgi:hypothetical protein
MFGGLVTLHELLETELRYRSNAERFNAGSRQVKPREPNDGRGESQMTGGAFTQAA